MELRVQARRAVGSVVAGMVNEMPASTLAGRNVETPRIGICTLGSFVVLIDDAPLTFSRKVQKKPLEFLKGIVACGGERVREERVSRDLRSYRGSLHGPLFCTESLLSPALNLRAATRHTPHLTDTLMQEFTRASRVPAVRRRSNNDGGVMRIVFYPIASDLILSADGESITISCNFNSDSADGRP